MVPRALLLSSDEKVSGLLSSALPAGTCTVDRCKDIFSAVEAITRDRFDILLIDWHEALEANFLLTTARDLRSKSSIFAVGLVTPAQGREALENGADAILVKPFTATQAAGMLLPKLGIECAPPVELGPEPEAKIDSPSGEPSRPVASPLQRSLATIATSDFRQPWKQGESTPVTHYPAASEPSPRLPSRRSRMLSLTAVVWPLIIAAALLVFDQWPALSRHTFARLSSLAADVQMRRLPGLPAHASQPPAGRDQLLAQSGGGDMPITDDLLSDYASPVLSVSATSQDQTLLPKKPDDIDLASIEALPSSSRLIVPVFTLEPSRPNLEVPASLRFPPPPTTTAAPVMPSGSGRLVAPEWIEGPIALPETISRALLEHQVTPLYPDYALQTGVDGPVVLQVSIGKDGAIRELKPVSGYLVLAHAAVDAVKQWRYKPYRRNGENVEVDTFITVNFKRPPRG